MNKPVKLMARNHIHENGNNKKKKCRAGLVLEKYMKIKCLSTVIKVSNYIFKLNGFTAQLTVCSCMRYLPTFEN